MAGFTRRALLAGSTLALGATGLPQQAAAGAHPSGKQAPQLYRYKIGDYELTAIGDGVWDRAIDESFVRNAGLGDVRKAMTDAFMPSTDKLPIPFTTLLVNTGSKLVLIDTGTGGQIANTAGTFGANLAAAGVSPKAIDIVLISHFHPDHINGIKTKDDERVFPNAEIKVPAAEWAYWMDDGNLSGADEGLKTYFLNTRRIFRTIAKDVARFEPGQDVAPGITAIAAPGHTPGHTAFAVASGGQSMLVLSDTSNHPKLFLRRPEWQAVVDMDGGLAVETRKRLLDRAVADRMLVQGYHFPFPASGHVIKSGRGFDLVPAEWRPV
jgi:glyoxylase-like metal-dependent hydrolase (beta-lactamase superfamily II)